MFSPFLLCFLSVATASETIPERYTTLVLSFDGFRNDYFRDDLTPQLIRFRDANASALYLDSLFPTRTFINHFSIATGLYPEEHGILDNTMFDAKNGRMHDSDEQFHYDERVVPLWMQNETENGGYSGVMWPGSGYKYQNKYPEYYQKYQKEMQWKDRVDKFMLWINNKDKPANFVMAYFEEPDSTAHSNGIESQKTLDQIARVDKLFKYILDKIKDSGLENKINLIVLSDHGMRSVRYENMIFLNEYGPSELYKAIITGCNGFVQPNPGQYETVYDNLKSGAAENGKFNVYKQEEIPDEWRLKKCDRLNGKLYLLAEPGYAFWHDAYAKVLTDVSNNKQDFCIGAHGYYDDPEMRTIFMAAGPNFRKNTKSTDGISLMEVYTLLKYLLGLKEPASEVQPNKSLDRMKQLLLPEEETVTIPIDEVEANESLDLVMKQLLLPKNKPVTNTIKDVPPYQIMGSHEITVTA